MALKSEMVTLKKFGSNIAHIRMTRQMTQEQLAEATNLDRMTIAFIENGRRWPRLSTIQTITNALGIEIQDLFKNL
jgi:transcriptional regulator with XRE-family HTH domain